MCSDFEAWVFVFVEKGELDVVVFADGPDYYAAFPGMFIAYGELAAGTVFGCAEAFSWWADGGGFCFALDGLFLIDECWRFFFGLGFRHEAYGDGLFARHG